jgi:ankyrin repeat-rich membrane spanning protein
LAQVQPLRLLFTDQTKVVTSAGGQNSVTQMIGSLLDAVEAQYGTLATRLYRAFRPQPVTPSAPRRLRRLCCIPYIIVYLACFFGMLAGIVLLCLLVHPAEEEDRLTIPTMPPAAEGGAPRDTADVVNLVNVPSRYAKEEILLGIIIFIGVVVGIVLVANLYTIGNAVQALVFSQRKQLQKAVAAHDVVKSEGYLQAVKHEVNLMLEMVRCLDAFSGFQTRLVVVVDGLDSCEQPKVLSVLDAVQILFSDPGAPFIILLAIDPHVIIKAIELNLTHFAYTSINGDAYLRNMVHLPFFLQNAGLRKVKAAQTVAANSATRSSKSTMWLEVDGVERKLSSQESRESRQHLGSRQGRNRLSTSVGSSIGSNLNKQPGGPQDLNRVLLSDDYFNDVNPRSLRRLMNVIYVMGRLLKAFNIEFNWYHLATWVNITEQWPYRYGGELENLSNT